MYSQKEPISTTISLTGEVTQFIWQIHVFLKKQLFTPFWVTLQPILRYIWNGKIYNELNFLIRPTPWQIIKITIITIKLTNYIKPCQINVA